MRKHNKKNKKRDNVDNNKTIECETKEIIPFIKEVRPKSEKQRQFIEAINKHDMVFAIGCAGTGKTMIACYLAAQYLIDGKVEKIVLTRPAIEACGEHIGFLPGDISEKMNSYLIPLYEFLYRAIGANRVKKMIEDGVIEILPLGFIRGRTLSRSFVILDEGQNVSNKSMLSFLTRMGEGSKFIVTGDTDQSDLPGNIPCGLVDAKERLQNIEEIKWIEFGSEDVMRHPIVKKIIDRYKNPEKK